MNKFSVLRCKSKSQDNRDSTFCDGSSKCCLSMVDMSNRSDVYMGLVPAVGLLCLCSKGSST